MSFASCSHLLGVVLLATLPAAPGEKEQTGEKAGSPFMVEVRGVLSKGTLNGVDYYRIQLRPMPKDFEGLSDTIEVGFGGKLRARADQLVGKTVVVTGPVSRTFLDRASRLRLAVTARTLEEARAR
jgi:hypothetical protein